MQKRGWNGLRTSARLVLVPSSQSRRGCRIGDKAEVRQHAGGLLLLDQADTQTCRAGRCGTRSTRREMISGGRRLRTFDWLGDEQVSSGKPS
jgi:hypothetical protein